MQRQRSSRSGRRRQVATARPPSSPDGSPVPRGWSRHGLALVAVAAVLIGVVGIERLTRPRSPTSAVITESFQSPPGGVATDADEPIPVARPDEGELAADADALAESLARDFATDGRALAVSARVLQLFVASDRARTRFERATRVAADEPEGWLGLAETAWHDGDFPAAAAAMEALQRVAPPRARDNAFLWADSLSKSGDAAGSAALLERFAEEDGGEASLPPWAQLMLGQARAQAGDHAGAVRALERVADDPRHGVVAAYGLAQAWARLGDGERSRRARESYLRLQESNLAAFDEAQARGAPMTSLAEKYPVLAGYHCEAGSLYARSGRFDAATSHWRRAAALAPEWPEPRRFLRMLAEERAR